MVDSRETLTIKAFVTGYPIKHSRSPLIHRYWLKAFGLDGSYDAIAVAPEMFEDFIVDLKSGKSNFVGGNVTIPHKESAYRLADKPDDVAQELGAANTLWLEDGQLHATNTDGYGFLSNLDARCPGWDMADRAVVLGAGGASRSVIQALRNRGIGEINVVNRTVGRAKELRSRFGVRVFAHPLEALPEVLAGAGLFVNTTSLGMDGAEAPQIDFSAIFSNAVVTDVVYIPLKTPILKAAQDQGFTTVDGLGMLLYQAKPGFEKWFGETPDVNEELRAIIIADMDKHA
ncbi:shikimate dehydrogenase [Agrobacterium sp. rho-8.1]|nr:shikimate dehydrogenase [Agrobacterium sp. rho-8.1]